MEQISNEKKKKWSKNERNTVDIITETYQTS